MPGRLAVLDDPVEVWSSEQWREEVLTWADITPIGPVTQPHLRSWSTALRIPTVDGVVWLKAASPGTSGEARLLQALSAYDAPGLLPLLKVDVERGWVLLPDGGPTLRSTLDRDPSLSKWETVLQGYAELQRAVAHRNLPGVEDQRPSAMPALFDLLVQELDVQRRDEVLAVRPRLVSWCAELDVSGIAPTLEHGDLHDGNAFASGRVFDWGDAVLAFPFSSLLVTLRSVAHRWSLEPGAPELARLRDAYLEPWTDTHSRTELELLCLFATRVAKVSRSRSWQRALAHDPKPGDDAEAAPGWLEELLEPDVF